MEFLIENSNDYLHHVVGSGECAALIQAALMKEYNLTKDQVVHTKWKRGTKVLNFFSKVSPGTPIATFTEYGSYPSCKTGNHAAIFMGYAKDGGIDVREQYHGKAVQDWHYKNYSTNEKKFPTCDALIDNAKRKSNDKKKFVPPTRDADWYYVIELDVKVDRKKPE